jgi:purine-binding chemotaxis protein CheW
LLQINKSYEPSPGRTTVHEAPSAVHLVSRAGSKLLALALPDIIEVMRPLALSRLDCVPAFVVGASVVRGAPVPVIDAGLLLGSGSSASAGSRWLSLRLGRRRAALAVDEVVGARTFDEARLEVMPPLLQGVASGAAASVAALDEQLVLVLSAGRIVPEPVWEALEALR